MKSVRNLVWCGSVLLKLTATACSPDMPVQQEAAAVTLSAVTPAAGPTAGGLEIALDGENFEAGATVLVGGEAATHVNVTSPGHLTATLPANFGSWGPVDLTVTNPNGRTVTRGDVFSYYASQPVFTGSLVVGGDLPASIIMNDFNSDRMPDIALFNSGDNSVDLFLGNGVGGVATASGFIAGGITRQLRSGTSGDFNGDGNMDLAAIDSNNLVSIVFGNGRGSFGIPTFHSIGANPIEMAAADFNGDKALDLIITHQQKEQNNVTILLGDGQGGFPDTRLLSVGTYPGGVAVGDFNADGKADFAVTDSACKVHVLLGDGRGLFQDTVTSLGIDTVPNLVAVGDFNRDEKQDLAVTDMSDGRVLILLGDGRGRFWSLTSFPTGAGAEAVAVADLNGDGLEDLAVNNRWDGTLSVMLGNGKGIFSSAALLSVSNSSPRLAVGDFNGDGKPDLVLSRAAYGAPNLNGFSIWLNSSK